MSASRPLRHAVLALALVIPAGCAKTPASTPAAPPAIVGAWRSSVQVTSGPFAAIKDLQFLTVFNAGGTMTESSNYDQMPPVAPAYGEWRASTPGRFESRYTFFTTNPPKDLSSLTTGAGWSPAGYGVITESYRLAPDGRSYDSRVLLELFDPAGKPVPGGGEGTAHGVRAGLLESK